MPISRTPFCRIGEHGFTFQLSSDYATTTFLSATMHFTKPDGTVSSQTCDNNDGGNGLWGWEVTQDFFDQRGWWMVSLEVELSAGTRKSLAPAFFEVGYDAE